MQAFRAQGQQQGQKHGGQGVVQAQGAHVGDQFAGKGAHGGARDPAQVGGDVAGEQTGGAAYGAVAEVRGMHGEHFVRHLQSEQGAQRAGQRPDVRSQGGGHKDMTQVDHEVGQHDGQYGRARAYHARRDELPRPGEDEGGHGHGP